MTKELGTVGAFLQPLATLLFDKTLSAGRRLSTLGCYSLENKTYSFLSLSSDSHTFSTLSPQCAVGTDPVCHGPDSCAGFC